MSQRKFSPGTKGAAVPAAFRSSIKVSIKPNTNESIEFTLRNTPAVNLGNKVEIFHASERERE
eukprot:m.316117 g.316117  ORF g.316117 m.316117 type:complete len:63 (-) comp23072_c1_seq37:17-205(-)